GIISGVLGIIPFVMGIISIVIGWGMWKGRRWSWSGFIILTLVGVVVNIIRFIPILFLSQSGQMLSSNNAITVILGSIIGISIGIGLSVLFIYYIYRLHVKAYFNKS
ncbi:MAG: hypothetical protein ABJB76_00165, partial [Candidatus Nitrosocosmicus sp.]